MDKRILQKAASFCAYQERTQEEVRQRLKKWNIWGDEAEELIAALISMNYLSEERFAKTYAGGKFRIKNWGRLKIKQELQRRGLSFYSIEKAIEEINEADYGSNLHMLLVKKKILLEARGDDKLKIKQKLVRFGQSKGYESELVWTVVEEIVDGM